MELGPAAEEIECVGTTDEGCNVGLVEAPVGPNPEALPVGETGEECKVGLVEAPVGPNPELPPVGATNVLCGWPPKGFLKPWPNGCGPGKNGGARDLGGKGSATALGRAYIVAAKRAAIQNSMGETAILQRMAFEMSVVNDCG